MNRYEREQKAFEYLQSQNEKVVTVQSVVEHSGWSEAAVSKYLKQNWLPYVQLLDSKTFKIIGFKDLSYEDFRAIQSQSAKLAASGLEPVDLSNPFSPQKLAMLLNRSGKSSSCLRKPEHIEVEYKANYGHYGLNNIARTIAAFANNNGGYIVFGVKDKTFEIVGCDLSDFPPRISPQEFTRELKDLYNPTISWVSEVYLDLIPGKNIGLLYIYPCKKKPVIATSSRGELRPGEIYYRYEGSTEKIRYETLREIIAGEVKKELDAFKRLLDQGSKEGFSNIELINLEKGELYGDRKYYLPQEVIRNISFIKEGHFSETGEKALRVVGDVLPFPTKDVSLITQYQHIGVLEIIEAFFSGKPVHAPEEFIKAVCTQNKSYLPIYFFAKQAQLDSSKKLSDFVSKCNPSQAVKRLLHQRINSHDDLSDPKTASIVGESDVPTARRRMLKLIKSKTLTNQDLANEEGIEYFFQVIPYLEKDEFEWNYLKPCMQHFFEQLFFTPKGSRFSLRMRKALCHIDKLLYREF